MKLKRAGLGRLGATTQVAVENALVLFFAVFLAGMMAGWGLARWSADVISGVGLLVIGVVLLSWIAWKYYATAGLLARLDQVDDEGDIESDRT